MNRDLPARLAEDLPETFIKIEFVGSEFKPRCLCFPRIGFLRHYRCHAISEIYSTAGQGLLPQHLRSAKRSVESSIECQALSTCTIVCIRQSPSAYGRRRAGLV